MPEFERPTHNNYSLEQALFGLSFGQGEKSKKEVYVLPSRITAFCRYGICLNVIFDPWDSCEVEEVIKGLKSRPENLICSNCGYDTCLLKNLREWKDGDFLKIFI